MSHEPTLHTRLTNFIQMVRGILLKRICQQPKYDRMYINITKDTQQRPKDYTRRSK